MATSRPTSSRKRPSVRPGTPLAPERLADLRARLARGESGKAIRLATGLGVGTITKYRNEWTADGSLVLPPESQRNIAAGRAQRSGLTRAESAALVDGETQSPPVGEVGHDDATGSQLAEPPAQPPERDLPAAGNVGEPPPQPPAAVPPAPPRYELPPDDEGIFGINEFGQIVVNVRFQVPVQHIAFKEQLERTGQIPPGMNLNTWYIAGMDDYLTAMWGQRLVLARVVEPAGAQPEREVAVA